MSRRSFTFTNRTNHEHLFSKLLAYCYRYRSAREAFPNSAGRLLRYGKAPVIRPVWYASLVLTLHSATTPNSATFFQSQATQHPPHMLWILQCRCHDRGLTWGNYQASGKTRRWGNLLARAGCSPLGRVGAGWRCGGCPGQREPLDASTLTRRPQAHHLSRKATGRQVRRAKANDWGSGGRPGHGGGGRSAICTK